MKKPAPKTKKTVSRSFTSSAKKKDYGDSPFAKGDKTEKEHEVTESTVEKGESQETAEAVEKVSEEIVAETAAVEEAVEAVVASEIEQAPKKRRGKAPLLIIGLFILVLIAIIPALYYYQQYQQAQQLMKNPTQAAKQEVDMLVAKVGKLIELPGGEIPTVATVSDKTKLENQVFFAKAKNGDKVLIYTRAKEAFLYRPTENKIITVAPINIEQPSQASSSPQASVSPTPAVPVTVAIYNGTSASGLAARAQTLLAGTDTTIEIVSRGNAKSSYEKTVVIDLTGKHGRQANALATVVKGTTGKLTAEETKPQADILIILGNDFVASLTPTESPSQ